MNASGRTLKKLSWAIAAASVFATGSALAQQASISLNGSTINYCNAVHNTWDISKTVKPVGDLGEGVTELNINAAGASVEWTITATKNPGEGPPPPAEFCVEGSLTITNGGSAPATVGNIVVNLQRMVTFQGKKRWISQAADISTKTSPLGATSANVVAAATAENATWNNGFNYSLSNGGQVGTFVTTVGKSGVITFSGPNWEDIFATSYTVAGNSTVTLTYTATFNGSALGINPAGDHLRTEILVTFGNAGGRGGSGASIGNGTGIAAGVDIDMDGNACLTGDPDECNVRTVPVRASLDVPPLEFCNDTATLDDILSSDGSDGGILYTVTATSEGVEGSDTCVANSTAPCQLTINASDTGSWTITTDLVLLNAGSSGTIANSVHLTGNHVNFLDIAVPDTICCETEDKSASATVTLTDRGVQCVVGVDPNCSCGAPGYEYLCEEGGGEFCTYTRGKLNPNSKNPVTTLVANNWGTTLFPSGLTFGVGSATSNNTAGDYAGFYNADGWLAIRQIMTATCPGCQVGSLGADAGTNPTTSGASNQVAQTLALMVAIELSNSSLPGFGDGLGDIVVCPNGTMPACTVQTYTINELITISNTILSGNTTTYPTWTGSAIQTLLATINNAFDDCQRKDPAWITSHTNVPPVVAP